MTEPLEDVRRGARLIGSSTQDTAAQSGYFGRHYTCLLVTFDRARPGHEHGIATTDLQAGSDADRSCLLDFRLIFGPNYSFLPDMMFHRHSTLWHNTLI
jgi:hypothetical protein